MGASGSVAGSWGWAGVGSATGEGRAGGWMRVRFEVDPAYFVGVGLGKWVLQNNRVCLCPFLGLGSFRTRGFAISLCSLGQLIGWRVRGNGRGPDGFRVGDWRRGKR